MNSNSMEHVQKEHFSFNTRMVSSPSEAFLKRCGCDTLEQDLIPFSEPNINLRQNLRSIKYFRKAWLFLIDI